MLMVSNALRVALKDWDGEVSPTPPYSRAQFIQQSRSTPLQTGVLWGVLLFESHPPHSTNCAILTPENGCLRGEETVVSVAGKTTTVPNAEKAFDKHGWKVLFALSAIAALFGLMDIALGSMSDPAVTGAVVGISPAEVRNSQPKLADLLDLIFRVEGLFLFSFSLLAMVISYTGFRRGERWAWYSLLYLPILYVLVPILFLTVKLVPERPLPPPLLSGPVFLVIALITLLLSYRKFFPKKVST